MKFRIIGRKIFIILHYADSKLWHFVPLESNAMNLFSICAIVLIFFSKHFICFSLKHLNVYFNRNLCKTEEWYPRCSKLVSAKLYGLQDFRPPEMMRLLTNTGLKSLFVGSDSFVVDEESFKKLVASQLDTLQLNVLRSISGLPVTTPDSSLGVNESVKDLYMTFLSPSTEPTGLLFPKYFRGLVQLSIHFASDSILQCIFQTQVGTVQYSLFILQQNGCKRNL